MTLNDDATLTVMLGALRYYLGRQTYAVGDFCRVLRSQWATLPEPVKRLIASEIEDEFRKDDEQRARSNGYKPLGMDCDREQWETVRALWQREGSLPDRAETRSGSGAKP